MNFDPIKELKDLVVEIEGKVPTDIIDLLDKKVEYYKSNGIHDRMHIGKTDWDLVSASEWLLSMFIGIIKKGKEDKRNFNVFGNWLEHVYHFVINNKQGFK
ncbi:gp130 [Bacillus phage G]|uniref:Gp130 n=1 Tax=Bacillus phage G TaxID=2884420 RepID=G3MBJ2_9CAUD|nr:gp130 [Bacillus phage G]AEO93392.1 gp130 [Bacillus phage G]